MAGPTVTFDKTSYAPGDVVTATVLRDIAATTVTLTATEANGATGTASVKIVEPLTVTDSSTSAHTWVLTTDDGMTAVYTTTA